MENEPLLLDIPTDEELKKEETPEETPAELPKEEVPVGDTEPEPDKLRELGLDKHYPSAEAALASIPHRERALTQAQMELARVRAELEQKPKETEKLQPDAFYEQFMADPKNTGKKVGLATTDDFDQLQKKIDFLENETARNKAAATISQYPELAPLAAKISAGVDIQRGENKMWDAFWDEVVTNPKLHAAIQSGAISDDLALELLYPRAKERLTPKPSAPVVVNKKESASTNSGKGTTTSSGEPDWDKMSTKQILEYHAERGLVR